MKRNIIFSVVISSIINGICALINLINIICYKDIPLGITLSGGEWVGRYGFGFLLEKIYPLTSVDESVQTYIKVRPNFESFLIPFIIVFIIVFIGMLIINNKKQVKM